MGSMTRQPAKARPGLLPPRHEMNRLAMDKAVRFSATDPVQLGPASSDPVRTRSLGPGQRVSDPGIETGSGPSPLIDKDPRSKIGIMGFKPKELSLCKNGLSRDPKPVRLLQPALFVFSIHGC